MLGKHSHFMQYFHEIKRELLMISPLGFNSKVYTSWFLKLKRIAKPRGNLRQAPRRRCPERAAQPVTRDRTRGRAVRETPSKESMLRTSYFYLPPVDKRVWVSWIFVWKSINRKKHTDQGGKFWAVVDINFTSIVNKSGPKIDPCWTPKDTALLIYSHNF